LDAAKEAIYLMAAEFGHTHTVSVTQHFNDMSHSFHFSGTQADKGLNQRLLEKMDCLHLFIDSFKDKLTQVKELAEIYQHSTTVNKAADQRNPLLVKTKAKELDLNQVGHRTLNFTASEFFTENERDTLRWLALGKSAQMIADINQVSRKTIERHIAAIKDKLGCYTLFQMGIKIAEKDMTPFLSKAVN
ncbi:MAG: LuxR family transcriptional regulator, partial [Legionella sp.]